MMTEEQQKLVAFLEEKIVSLRFAVRQNAFEKIRPELKHELDCAEIALAALTQPAGPALKLPEVPPNALVALCEQMYDHRSTGVTVAHDVWQDCIEELRIDVPHTAPIEPIRATGGAEWVKVPRELQQVLLELRTYNPKADEYGGKHIMPGWADRIEKALGIKPSAPEEE